MTTIARMLDAAFNPEVPAVAYALPVSPVNAAVHRKLWQWPSHWLDPLLGALISDTELRSLAERVGLAGPGLPDHTLRTVAVGLCGRRGEVADLIEQFLDHKYEDATKRLGAHGESSRVLAWWRAALTGGNALDALWATLTHAALNEDDAGTVFAEFLGFARDAVAQAELRQRQRLSLTEDNRRLRDEAEALRHELQAAQREHEQRIAALALRLSEAQRRDGAALAATARRASEPDPLPRDRQRTLERQLAELTERNATLLRQKGELETLLRFHEDTIPCPRTEGDADNEATVSALPRLPERHLAGRRVLCIGGLTRLAERYRDLVEERGGRFAHHDGGTEESIHRLDALVANADAVVCQAGCISHNAYWALKDACKRRGLPCVFLKSSGVTSFARGLETLAN